MIHNLIHTRGISIQPQRHSLLIYFSFPQVEHSHMTFSICALMIYLQHSLHKVAFFSFWIRITPCIRFSIFFVYYNNVNSYLQYVGWHASLIYFSWKSLHLNLPKLTPQFFFIHTCQSGIQAGDRFNDYLMTCKLRINQFEAITTSFQEIFFFA